MLSMFQNNKLLLILKCAWPQATFYMCDLQPATRNLQNNTSLNLRVKTLTMLMTSRNGIMIIQLTLNHIPLVMLYGNMIQNVK